jgi:hypothetical protein
MNFRVEMEKKIPLNPPSLKGETGVGIFTGLAMDDTRAAGGNRYEKEWRGGGVRLNALQI